AAPTFRLTGAFINEFQRIGPHHCLQLVKPGSSLSASNTDFATDLTGWSQSGTGESWAWSSDNSGSAEVTLSGAEDAKKLYQEISHSGGYIQISGTVYAVNTSGNLREDILFAVFYRGSSIIHTEKIKTLNFISSLTSSSFSHTAFAPGQVNRIGFFVKYASG